MCLHVDRRLISSRLAFVQTKEFPLTLMCVVPPGACIFAPRLLREATTTPQCRVVVACSSCWWLANRTTEHQRWPNGKELRRPCVRVWSRGANV